MNPGQTGLRRIVSATGHSFRGLASAFRTEAAFRQEFLLCAVLLPLSFWLAESPWQWLWLVTPLLVLLIVELLNSAVEAAIDRIGPERHELSGRAKDMGSAAVMMSLLLLTLTWGTALWERLLA